MSQGIKNNQGSVFGRLISSGFNRENLSKSIILHHNKNASLIQTAGRYNDDLYIQDINDEEEEHGENGRSKKVNVFEVIGETDEL